LSAAGSRLHSYRMQPVQPITRRAWLRLTACGLAGATLTTRASGAGTGIGEPASAFSFIVANDLHYRDARCAKWFLDVVANIRALQPQPAFVVLAGDLSEDGASEQLGAVQEIFATLPMPVKTVIGNHDYSHAEQRSSFIDRFGAPLNRRFTFRDWQFLTLDTTEGRRVYRTRVPDETLQWMDRVLPQLSRSEPLVVITHFPLGRNWLRPMNAHALLERLRPFNLQATFSGHWHGWTKRVEHHIPLTTGRCCSWWRENHDGSDAKGYLLCRASAAGVTHQFVQVT
jgi:predicted MPP superfamily phosphohydrolase